MSTATTLPAQQPAHGFTQVKPSSLRQSTLKKNMSITQTYYLAHKARGKLSHEAAQPDHDLRLLVGHANLLDSLVLELADAEREQERWFNQSVRGANGSSGRKSTTERRIQWADQVIEEEEYDSDSSDDSESDSDFDEEDDVSMNYHPEPTKMTYSTVVEDNAVDSDDEEDLDDLALVRTHSHSNDLPSPPELVAHEEDSSEDESMPPSPPQTAITTFSQKELKADEEDSDADEQRRSLFEEEYYVHSRQPTSVVSAISVY